MPRRIGPRPVPVPPRAAQFANERALHARQAFEAARRVPLGVRVRDLPGVGPARSGPSTRTRLTYALDGYRGELDLTGGEYIDGVVLADGRQPSRALCVTAFPYDLDRDESGNWVGKLRTTLKLGMFGWALYIAAFLGTAFAMAYFEDDTRAWLCEHGNMKKAIDCSLYE
jgi:hypothetical protein